MTRRALLLAAVLVMPGVLRTTTAEAAAGGSGEAGPVSSRAGPVSSSTYRAAVGFADIEYSAPFYGRLWNDSSWGRPLGPEAATTARAQYPGAVAAVEDSGSALDLSFAVESQSGRRIRPVVPTSDAKT